MNFTFTWILDKFGFQPKAAFDFPIKKETIKPAAKKVTKKSVKIPKATTRKTIKK